MELQLVDQLREKLERAKLSREDLQKVFPPEVERKIRKFNEPDKPEVPEEQVQKYLQEFAEAKEAGRFAHLPPEQLEVLEEEVKVAASDSEKAKDLEEFLRVVKEEAQERKFGQEQQKLLNKNAH
ncbi:hypothetical protein E2C01_006806 [Portunus trituberculatus]|uniref:Uncharacterized protein n=1 Tax=Portunus trituberculatus TaxID=210409 RepID=A0A5B7D2T7_PORTR|nr:hypothetical protein [Portunus trituberculatus]